jgi:hypothetical protein
MPALIFTSIGLCKTRRMLVVYREMTTFLIIISPFRFTRRK